MPGWYSLSCSAFLAAASRVRYVNAMTRQIFGPAPSARSGAVSTAGLGGGAVSGEGVGAAASTGDETEGILDCDATFAGCIPRMPSTRSTKPAAAPRIHFGKTAEKAGSGGR